MANASVMSPGPSAVPLGLGGRWVNQLGSELVIVVGSDGCLSGEYCGSAGTLAGHRYPLVGAAESPSGDHVAPLAFVVHWTEAHCVTAWSGRFVPGPEDEIRATWLMTSEVPAGDDWKATVTGHDVFHRCAPHGSL